MAFGTSLGNRHRISIFPPAILPACSRRATARFGLALRTGLQVGRTASSPNTRNLAASVFLRFLRIAKAQYGPAGSQTFGEDSDGALLIVRRGEIRRFRED